MTESPRRNIFLRRGKGISEAIAGCRGHSTHEMNRSLLTGFLFLPFGTSVHIWRGSKGRQPGAKSAVDAATHLLDVLQYLQGAAMGHVSMRACLRRREGPV